MFYTIFDRLDRAEIEARIRFPTIDILNAALQRGNGVYVAMSHYGSHHVAAMIMAFMDYPLAGVRDRNEGALRRFIQWKFARTFPNFDRYRMFFADAFPRDIFRCYRDNFVVCSALDVNVRRLESHRLKTMSARLLGEEQNFLVGPIQMAGRCKAPVLQGFVIAGEDFRYELRVAELCGDPEHIARSDEALGRIIRDYADGIEQFVQEYPCHLSRI